MAISHYGKGLDVMDANLQLNVLVVSTALGLMAWLVRRVFTHTIPRLAQDFKETLQSEQKLFVGQLDDQRSDFKEMLTQQREDFKEAMKDERIYLGQKIDRLAEAIDTLISRANPEDD